MCKVIESWALKSRKLVVCFSHLQLKLAQTVKNARACMILRSCLLTIKVRMHMLKREIRHIMSQLHFLQVKPLEYAYNHTSPDMLPT